MGKENRPFIEKNQPDAKFWSKIKKLAQGPVSEKAQAVDLIFENYVHVPKDADDLLKELVRPKSPVNIRRRIAKALASKPGIPWGLYLGLLSTLVKDKDKQVATTVEPLFEPYGNIQKSLEAYAVQQSALMRNILGPDFFKNVAKQLDTTRLFGQYYDDIVKYMTEPIPFFKFPLQDQIIKKSMPTFSLPQSTLDTISNLRTFNADVLGSLSVISPSYFRAEEPVTLEKSKNELITKLKQIPPGQEHWHDYQTACKNVLTYCFVPPLLDPTEESSTEDTHHRRDIIYPIAQGEEGFWGYIQNAYFAISMIIEAKNYSEELPSNQVVITSKYFGPKKLGNFGLIISPKGPSTAARKEQKDRWLHHGEMILCLSNSDLERMLALKEKGDRPEIVIDRLIRELRQSI